jgi:hypothetical protein
MGVKMTMLISLALSAAFCTPAARGPSVRVRSLFGDQQRDTHGLDGHDRLPETFHHGG